MEVITGSIDVEADGAFHTVASFSFDSFESGMGFVGFVVQFLDETLRNLVKHGVPVHCEINPVAVAELGGYVAMIVVSVPDSEWVDRLWPVMVCLSKNMMEIAESEGLGFISWMTHEEREVLA